MLGEVERFLVDGCHRQADAPYQAPIHERGKPVQRQGQQGQYTRSCSRDDSALGQANTEAEREQAKRAILQHDYREQCIDAGYGEAGEANHRCRQQVEGPVVVQLLISGERIKRG